MSNGATKNTYWIFLSYARRDAKGRDKEENPYFVRFYKDLALEIGKVAGLPSSIPEKDIEFYDREDIPVGANWSETLASALQGSKVFICLYSPSYFNSEYCGKEFQVFQNRLKEHVKTLGDGEKAPELIIPVLWEHPNRLPSKLPDAVDGIQYADKSLGAMYAENGVAYLLRMGEETAYQRFLMNLADKIYKEAQAPSPAPLPHLEPLAKIKSAFHIAAAPASSSAGPDVKGFKVAWFVYVAGAQTDYAAVRQMRTCYGTSGLEWQPYQPDTDEIVGYLAATVATTKGLTPVPVPVGNDLIQRLQEAEDNNTMVVLIVDPWSIKLPVFQQPMKTYDAMRLTNCGVIVLWNDKDEETRLQRADLDSLLRKTFSRQLVTGDLVFYPKVQSQEALREKLAAAIEEVKSRIYQRGKYLRGEVTSDNDPFPKLPTSGKAPNTLAAAGGQ